MFVLFVSPPRSPSSSDAEEMLGPRSPGHTEEVPRHLLLGCTYYFLNSQSLCKIYTLFPQSFRTVLSSFYIDIMAGEVRQPIDIPSLEKYIDQHVPEVKTPLDVKQVSLAPSIYKSQYQTDELILCHDSSASVNQILPTFLLPLMASRSFCARSPLASCSQRRLIRSSASIRLSGHCGIPMYPFPGRTACAKMTA